MIPKKTLHEKLRLLTVSQEVISAVVFLWQLMIKHEIGSPLKQELNVFQQKEI